jgi:hypothetical protein
MLTVNIHDAKTQLSKLVEQAAQGESIGSDSIDRENDMGTEPK